MKSLIKRFKKIINRITGKNLLIEVFSDIKNIQYKTINNNDLFEKLQFLATESSAEYIKNYMSNAVALSSVHQILDKAISLTDKDREGLFLEFGVYSGSSINYIASKTKNIVYGFDSFQGLPEKWRDGFDKSAFNRDGELPEVEKNVQLIKGWFDATLPLFVSKHPGPINLLHIDCDIYSSTKTIFENLGSRIVPGTVIVFDEYFNYPNWENHEHKAFLEFIKESNLKFEYLYYNRYHEQVLARII